MLSDHYVDGGGGGGYNRKDPKNEHNREISPAHVTAKQIVGKVMKTVRTEQNPVSNMIIASKNCLTHANVYAKLFTQSIFNFSRIKIGFDHSYSPPPPSYAPP